MVAACFGKGREACNPWPRCCGGSWLPPPRRRAAWSRRKPKKCRTRQRSLQDLRTPVWSMSLRCATASAHFDVAGLAHKPGQPGERAGLKIIPVGQPRRTAPIPTEGRTPEWSGAECCSWARPRAFQDRSLDSTTCLGRRHLEKDQFMFSGPKHSSCQDRLASVVRQAYAAYWPRGSR